MDQYEHVRKYPLNVVLAALGFETFKYRKAGTEGYGACPIHGSKKNTTCFSFDDDGRFNCFSCSAKGKGAIDLKMAVSKCGFQEAVEWLKTMTPENVSTEGPKTSVHFEKNVSLTENPLFKGTYEKYKIESPWLKDRGLLQATLDIFEVFQYSNPARRSAYNGSVMLKIRRWSDSECVGYLIRNIGEVTQERPKYAFPKGLAKSLEVFGAWQIKNSGQKLPPRVGYALESPFAVMKFHQLGFPAVSCFGWCVSGPQADILMQLAKGWIFLPDRNKYAEAVSVAGELSRRVWVKMPELSAGVDDPESLNAEQIRAMS